MRVLVVGGGGREHALVWSLGKSPSTDVVMCAPGNAGIEELADTFSVPNSDFQGLIDLAKVEKVDLVVIGPEAPLVAGLSDALRDEGIRVFGPSKAAAQIEGSKSFAKGLMLSSGIPTAGARVFDNLSDALAHVDHGDPPCVVKADGLAAGKGVTVCSDRESAHSAVREAMEAARFGEAGERVLIEEALQGQELSVLALTDGRDVVAMEPAQDYKRISDGDTGPNTGGMGAYSPVPAASDETLALVSSRILDPTIAAMAEEGIPYAGVLYAGLMLTDDGPKVIEFNCRFGDPEAQAVIPRFQGDLLEAMMACLDGNVVSLDLPWSAEACVTVVCASGGYPGDYETGYEISGLAEAESITGIPVFHAGTERNTSGDLVTSGGRVLAVSALGPSFEEARSKAYEAADKIEFEGMYKRTDIASRAVGG